MDEYKVTVTNGEMETVEKGDCEATTKKFITIINQAEEGKIQTGDELAIDSEHFYVVSATETETVLLAKYNLLVGENYNNGTRVTISEETEGYGWQNESATGVTSSNLSTNIFPGVTSFGGSYWHDASIGNVPKNNYAKDINGNAASYSGNPYPYVYDSNSNLYVYVNNYRKNLEGIGAEIKNARLMTYEEAANEDIGCSTTNDSCPDWISNTSFYIGSVRGIYDWHIYSPSKNLYAGSHYSNADSGKGIRPVIVINTSDIEI